MGYMSGGGFSLNKYTLSQQYCDFDNCDGCSGYGIANSHTISQCQDSISFKKIHNDVEDGDGGVRSGYGFKTATISLNVTIQVYLTRFPGMFTILI